VVVLCVAGGLQPGRLEGRGLARAMQFRMIIVLITVLVFVIQSTIAMPTIGKPGTSVLLVLIPGASIRFKFDRDLVFVLSSLSVFVVCLLSLL